jgi:hypothetical protein
MLKYATVFNIFLINRFKVKIFLINIRFVSFWPRIVVEFTVYAVRARFFRVSTLKKFDCGQSAA